MKSMVVACVLTTLSSICLSQNIKVRLDVSADDVNIRNVITSQLRTSINALNYMSVAETGINFVLKITVVEIRNGENVNGISMSTILVKKRIIDGQDIYQLMTNALNIVENDPERMKAKCIELVARFDVNNYFK